MLIQLVKTFTSHFSVLFILFGVLSLALSLSIASPHISTAVINQILLSVIVLRSIEFISFARANAQGQFSMTSNNHFGFVCGVALEILSIGFRSISLGFRIFANVSAGHVLSDIAGVMRFFTLGGELQFVLSIAHILCLAIYETFVACVQTGVYIALVAVYAS